jgi:hypothetical protein
VGNFVFDSSASEEGPAASSFQHGNEPSGSVRGGGGVFTWVCHK